MLRHVELICLVVKKLRLSLVHCCENFYVLIFKFIILKNDYCESNAAQQQPLSLYASEVTRFIWIQPNC